MTTATITQPQPTTTTAAVATHAGQVLQVLDLSTRHLPEQLADNLNALDGVVAYRVDADGWLLSVPTDPGSHLDDYADTDNLDPDYEAVLGIWRYARALGCDYVLLDRDAPAATPAPRCTLDEDALRAWLESPCGDSEPAGAGTPPECGCGARHWSCPAGGAEPTVAGKLGVEWFNEDSDDGSRPGRLVDMVRLAQQPGVFGVDGHSIVLWVTADETKLNADGYLITVDRPDWTRLSSAWIADPTPVGELGGVASVVAFLANVAGVVNRMLDRADGPAADMPALPVYDW